MTELLISEITLMGEGVCVIGLERNTHGFRSLRPIPPTAYAWKNFPYGRADKVAFDLSATLTTRPHIEDRQARSNAKRGSIPEADLVKCLLQAETSSSLKGLFSCDVHSSPRGGPAVYVDPKDADRSICGCEVQSVHFSLKFYPPKIRAALYLKSGECLQSLPVVDVAWSGFISDIANQFKDQPNFRVRLQRFFDSCVRQEILRSQIPFARIGLTRPDREGFCWLMLDSLFPLPQKSWLNQFR